MPAIRGVFLLQRSSGFGSPKIHQTHWAKSTTTGTRAFDQRRVEPTSGVRSLNGYVMKHIQTHGSLTIRSVIRDNECLGYLVPTPSLSGQADLRVCHRSNSRVFRTAAWSTEDRSFLGVSLVALSRTGGLDHHFKQRIRTPSSH